MNDRRLDGEQKVYSSPPGPFRPGDVETSPDSWTRGDGGRGSVHAVGLQTSRYSGSVLNQVHDFGVRDDLPHTLRERAPSVETPEGTTVPKHGCRVVLVLRMVRSLQGFGPVWVVDEIDSGVVGTHPPSNCTVGEFGCLMGPQGSSLHRLVRPRGLESRKNIPFHRETERFLLSENRGRRG